MGTDGVSGKQAEGLSSGGLHVAVQRSPGRIIIRGRDLLDFGSFDPLSLALHPRVVRRAGQALAAPVAALSSSSPRRSCGTHMFHVEAEARAAQFFGQESALIFSSRNQALISLFSQLVEEGDVIIVDEQVQAPILDIAHLMGASMVALPVVTVEAVRRECQRLPPTSQRFLFLESTSPKACGTIPQDIIQEMFHVEHLQIVLDESCSVPILGIRGAGLSDNHLGRLAVTAVVLDTGVSFGVSGGLIATSSHLAGQIVEQSANLQTEGCSSPLLAAVLDEAISVAELSHEGRGSVLTQAMHLRSGLIELGIRSNEQCIGSLVPIPCPSLSSAQTLADALFQRGVYVECVPRGTHLTNSAIIRLAIRASHTRAAVDQLLNILADLLPRCV